MSTKASHIYFEVWHLSFHYYHECLDDSMMYEIEWKDKTLVKRKWKDAA
jgi:hypothetical protein